MKQTNEKGNGFQILARALVLCLVVLTFVADAGAQRKRSSSQSKAGKTQPTSELEKLKTNYIQTTKELKASLEKLLALYEASARKAQDRSVQSKELYNQGLISQSQLDESDRAAATAQSKANEVRRQIAGADTQVAQTLVEIDGEKQLAKLGRVPKGGLIRTTSFIRYGGAGSWSLSQAGKIENFFQAKFGRPLPIAVFGQGAIHNQWRLDHHNAMDISLNPDGVEGQALVDFLRSNGIPFSAFRTAIPGVATGPHIHIGMPSHRY